MKLCRIKKFHLHLGGRAIKRVTAIAVLIIFIPDASLQLDTLVVGAGPPRASWHSCPWGGEVGVGAWSILLAHCVCMASFLAPWPGSLSGQKVSTDKFPNELGKKNEGNKGKKVCTVAENCCSRTKMGLVKILKAFQKPV